VARSTAAETQKRSRTRCSGFGAFRGCGRHVPDARRGAKGSHSWRHIQLAAGVSRSGRDVWETLPLRPGTASSFCWPVFGRAGNAVGVESRRRRWERGGAPGPFVWDRVKVWQAWARTRANSSRYRLAARLRTHRSVTPTARRCSSCMGPPGSRLSGRHPDPSRVADAGLRVITCDLPGNGRSTRHPGRAVVDCVADIRCDRGCAGDRTICRHRRLGRWAARVGRSSPPARACHPRGVQRRRRPL
jgi:hypothetical protein